MTHTPDLTIAPLEKINNSNEAYAFFTDNGFDDFLVIL
jgi:hypothetical protein